MDWPMYRHVECQANRMIDMIQRLGVDSGKLVRLEQGGAYAEARQKCLSAHVNAFRGFAPVLRAGNVRCSVQTLSYSNSACDRLHRTIKSESRYAPIQKLKRRL